MKRILCTAAAILISSAAFIPAQSMAQGVRLVVVNQEPPAPRREMVPAARRGYEWAPGYWNWTGRKHVWVGGHWERARAGHHYQRPEWRQGNKGWELQRGGWQPGATRNDRDGDGVPNRRDSQPDNSHRN